MDSISKFNQIVTDALDAYARKLNRVLPEERQLQTIYDHKQMRYMLVTIGWRGRRRVLSVEIYIRIENGKIWIEADETEDGISTELLAQGIPNTSIILGFYRAERRELTEFAFAV